MGRSRLGGIGEVDILGITRQGNGKTLWAMVLEAVWVIGWYELGRAVGRWLF